MPKISRKGKLQSNYQLYSFPFLYIKLKKDPQGRVTNSFLRVLFFLFFWWYKFQQITNLTIQHCT